MSQVEKNREVPSAQMIAIRQARRYLKRDSGTLARILNAYHRAAESGTQRGHLLSR
ncbi:MAG: hypothetical protein WBC85_01350 [Planktotalea sp.]|uniref:hypothetical protein n=1 Tax=Planktotalea sp. TaxID=2029877 RepID=UPI003C78367C